MAEQPKPAIPAFPEGIVDRLKAFIVWLGGAVAGITAIFYAAGYLAVRGQLTMLGLRGVVDSDSNELLQEGGMFFFRATQRALTMALPLAAILIATASAVFVVWPLLRRAVAAALSYPVLVRLWARWSAWPQRLRPQLVRAFPYAVFVGLMFALYGQANQYWQDLQRAFGDEFTNRLFQSPKRSSPSPSETSLYGHMFWSAAFSGALFVAAWPVASSWLKRAWLITPFALVAIYAIGTLPLASGVLESRKYASVQMFDDANSLATDGILLGRSSDAFVVWMPQEGRVRWFAKDHVKRVDVLSLEPLFPNAAAPDGGVPDAVEVSKK
jgi:hypothetical protein